MKCYIDVSKFYFNIFYLLIGGKKRKLKISKIRLFFKKSCIIDGIRFYPKYHLKYLIFSTNKYKKNTLIIQNP